MMDTTYGMYSRMEKTMEVIMIENQMKKNVANRVEFRPSPN